MVQTIIFDFYGVLAFNGWQNFKAKYFTGKPEQSRAVFELGRKADAGRAEYAEFVRFTAQKTGASEDIVRYQLEHTVPNDELLAYIRDQLKPKYKLGILSNASSDIVGRILTPEDEAMFDAIILSHHVGLTKPDTRMYRTAAEHLRTAASDCLFVDDQQQHIDGAKEIGMQTILYTKFVQFKADFKKLSN